MHLVACSPVACPVLTRRAAQVGFFADAGPLQLFVSNHLIPDDFDFVSADEPAFVSADEAVRVQAGAEVRMRIVGTRMDATEIVRSRACAGAPAACLSKTQISSELCVPPMLVPACLQSFGSALTCGSTACGKPFT